MVGARIDSVAARGGARKARYLGGTPCESFGLFFVGACVGSSNDKEVCIYSGLGQGRYRGS